MPKKLPSEVRNCVLHLADDSLTIDRDGWYFIRRFHGKDRVEYAEKDAAVSTDGAAGIRASIEPHPETRIRNAICQLQDQAFEYRHDGEVRQLKTHSYTVVPADIPRLLQVLMDRINQLEEMKGKINAQHVGAPTKDSVRDRRKRARELKAQGKKLSQITDKINSEFGTKLTEANVSQDINGRKRKPKGSQK